MSIDFGIIASIVKGAYDAYNTLKGLLDQTRPVSNQEIANLISKVLFAVDQARKEIISEIRGTRLADLLGDVNGLQIRFGEYTIYNKSTQREQWRSEGERLREIIDDATGVMTDLQAELNRLNLARLSTLLKRLSDVEYACSVFLSLAILVPLRAMAMIERSRNYATNDHTHIEPMWDLLRAQTDTMHAALRQVIDKGFSGVMTRRGEPAGQGKYILMVGYKFNGRFVLLYEAHQDVLRNLIKRAKQELERRKANYLCLQTVLAVKAELEPHSFESLNYPGHFVRHRYFRGKISRVTSDTDRKDATFRIVRGLADTTCISFESVNFPCHFLRHRNFELHLDPASADQLFKKDATFQQVAGLADRSQVSFESLNYPARFIRHRNFFLYIEKGDTDPFRKDATFKITKAQWP